VLPVQPVCFLTRDEELGAVADGPTWPRVFQDEVFIIKLLPVDGFASGSIVVGEVTSLAHELGDDAVEAAPFEAKAFLMGAEAAEILCPGQGERGEGCVCWKAPCWGGCTNPHPRSWARHPSAAGSAAALQACFQS
uniref:Uncharacterized protein n=1 Tax=Melopsittacus undulatus TaxID=13146 RepID=A0A8C6IS37_MELUD